MVSVIANKGNLVKPYIVKRIGANEVGYARPRNIGFKDVTLRIIRKGMFDAINSAGGTGKQAKVKGLAVAGKTGTAQNPQGETHAWFAGFAPYEKPKLSLIVFLEHGGKGGAEAARIARIFFKEAKAKGCL